MLSWICSAISTIRVASFAYESTWYVVEPFVYGTRDDGEDVLVGYVLKSSTEGAVEREWKVFVTSKIGARVINYDAIRRDRPGMPEVNFKSTYCQVKRKAA